MVFMGCAVLLQLHRKKRLDIHPVFLNEVNAVLKLASLGSKLKLATTKDPCLNVPKHFHEFLHIFEKGKA